MGSKQFRVYSDLTEEQKQLLEELLFHLQEVRLTQPKKRVRLSKHATLGFTGDEIRLLAEAVKFVTEKTGGKSVGIQKATEDLPPALPGVEVWYAESIEEYLTAAVEQLRWVKEFGEVNLIDPAEVDEILLLHPKLVPELYRTRFKDYSTYKAAMLFLPPDSPDDRYLTNDPALPRQNTLFSSKVFKSETPPAEWFNFQPVNPRVETAELVTLAQVLTGELTVTPDEQLYQALGNLKRLSPVELLDVHPVLVELTLTYQELLVPTQETLEFLNLELTTDWENRVWQGYDIIRHPSGLVLIGLPARAEEAFSELSKLFSQYPGKVGVTFNLPLADSPKVGMPGSFLRWWRRTGAGQSE